MEEDFEKQIDELRKEFEKEKAKKAELEAQLTDAKFLLEDMDMRFPEEQ